MTSSIAPTRTTAAAPAGDAVVALRDVSWDLYRSLRASPSNEALRMTYDGRDLILMSPSRRHERVAELLGHFVIEWAMSRNVPLQGCGALTLRREDLSQGTEPDKCFYVQSEPALRGGDEFDLAVDPPPDLVIEVDVTALSSRKLAIYAKMSVPEVWLWKNEAFRILGLQAGRFVEIDRSAALPGFPFDEAMKQLDQRHERDDITLVRAFRTAIEQPSEP